MEIDKYIHAVVCLCITCVVALIAKSFGMGANATCALIGAAVAMTIGVAKEVADVRRTGFSWADIMADGAGAIVGFGFAMMM